MKKSCVEINLCEYRHCFDRLQAIVFRDISVNRVKLRILGINYMDNGPEWTVNRHKHSFFEFHYVTGNHTFTTINGTEHKVEQSNFYLMPSNTHHSHREEPGPGHVGFSLRWEFLREKDSTNQFHGQSLEYERTVDILENAHSSPVWDDGGVISGMLDLFKLADNEAGPLQLQLALVQVILTIAAFYRSKGGRAKEVYVPGFYENNVVQSAVRFIEENYSQGIDAMDVANSVHMSYSHLSRLFKKYTGATIKSLLNNTRLLKAQKLLLLSDKTIAQVGGEVGFSSEQHFCSSFRKFCGLSPGVYRSGKHSLHE